MAKFTITVSKVERIGTGANVSVTIAAVVERGQVAPRPVTRIVTVAGQVTQAAVRAEVEAIILAERAERAVVGASFEVDV
jgi:hypothetical protein